MPRVVARKASLKEGHARASGPLQPYRVASSLQSLLGLQHGPLHGWGGHGILVCLIIPHTQGPRACIDLETKHKSQSQVGRGWLEVGLPKIEATQPHTAARLRPATPENRLPARPALSQNNFTMTLQIPSFI